MQSKLQELTDRLYKEGLSKGKEEGEALVAKAEDKASEIIAEAQRKAEAIIEKAQKDANDLKIKVQGDVKMAATQSIQATKRDIENLLMNGMIGGKATSVLSSADFVKEIITAVAKNFNSQDPVDLEVVLPESLKSELEPFINTQLVKALSSNVTAKFSGKIPAGFTIGPKDGSYFIDLTSESFENLIGEYLRPATKKLLFGE
ncbi:MAG: hypothetical protein J5907_10100 [Bacteroidales bacterium]|jgi:V/A-type H+-transporting ATPase subunit E|nr:hypothetical protein [Bacteroidales bacterium]